MYLLFLVNASFLLFETLSQHTFMTINKK